MGIDFDLDGISMMESLLCLPSESESNINLNAMSPPSVIFEDSYNKTSEASPASHTVDSYTMSAEDECDELYVDDMKKIKHKTKKNKKWGKKWGQLKRRMSITQKDEHSEKEHKTKKKKKFPKKKGKKKKKKKKKKK